MLINIVAQIPPTPTLMAVPTAPVSIPSFGVWASTDDLIQLWNLNSGVTTGFQYVVLVGVVIAGIFVLVHFIRTVSRGSDEE